VFIYLRKTLCFISTRWSWRHKDFILLIGLLEDDRREYYLLSSPRVRYNSQVILVGKILCCRNTLPLESYQHQGLPLLLLYYLKKHEVVPFPATACVTSNFFPFRRFGMHYVKRFLFHWFYFVHSSPRNRFYRFLVRFLPLTLEHKLSSLSFLPPMFLSHTITATPGRTHHQSHPVAIGAAMTLLDSAYSPSPPSTLSPCMQSPHPWIGSCAAYAQQDRVFLPMLSNTPFSSVSSLSLVSGYMPHPLPPMSHTPHAPSSTAMVP
jgi:hypothetical protein